MSSETGREARRYSRSRSRSRSRGSYSRRLSRSPRRSSSSDSSRRGGSRRGARSDSAERHGWGSRSCCGVYVKGLDVRVTEDDLYNHFIGEGRVRALETFHGPDARTDALLPPLPAGRDGRSGAPQRR